MGSGMEEDGKKKKDLQDVSDNIEPAEEHNSTKSLIQRIGPADLLILNITELQRKSKFSKSCSRQLLFQFHGLDDRLPKHLVSLDEKYIRRCLEMMHVSAFRAASANLSSNAGILSNSFGSRKICIGSMYDSTMNGHPFAAETESVVISSMEDQILGSITGSKSMMTILGSPLLQQYSGVDSDVNTRGASLLDAAESSDSESLPSGSTASLSQKVSKEMLIGDQGYKPRPVHERIVSVSSTNSTLSDQSSSATSNFICHGMLHCTWKDGFPQYVFSIDDQREVYAAHLFKVDSPDDKVLDYVYTFHSRPGGKLECEIRENESHSNIVGKMRVSTMIRLCPNNSEITETQFVLFGSSDNSLEDMQTSTGTARKNKPLRKKVTDAFRSTHSFKQRTSSKFSGSSAILEGSSWEPSEELLNNFDPGGFKITESEFPPNLELAAIIVKEHLSGNCKKAEIGGWGLKFLKNTEIRRASTSLESGECSTSMDILVPAGFHGGPRTRNGGPSSLTERWSSGGHCDCGGWDTGCPLTVLNMGSSRRDISTQAEISEDCNTFDLFVQGSKQSIPTMKMTNIHEGLYYIHFQSVLSALQAFSIATAIIHSHSPTLRPKVYRNRINR